MINEKLSKDQNGQRKWQQSEKEYKHKQWEKRQEQYKKIIGRDCYGIKKNKV